MPPDLARLCEYPAEEASTWRHLRCSGCAAGQRSRRRAARPLRQWTPARRAPLAPWQLPPFGSGPARHRVVAPGQPCPQQRLPAAATEISARRTCKTPRWRSRRLGSATTASWPRPSALATACAVCSARRRSDVYMRTSGSPCSAAASAAACSMPRALRGGSSWPCSLAQRTILQTGRGAGSRAVAQGARLQGPAARLAALKAAVCSQACRFCRPLAPQRSQKTVTAASGFHSVRQHASRLARIREARQPRRDTYALRSTPSRHGAQGAACTHWRSCPGVLWLKPALPASAGAVPWSKAEDLAALRPLPCSGAPMLPASLAHASVRKDAGAHRRQSQEPYSSAASHAANAQPIGKELQLLASQGT